VSVAEYTVVNLKEVEDMALKSGLAPNLEYRSGGPLELESSGLSYQRLAPNFRTPFGHKHKQQEELYILVGGSGRVKIDDEIVDVKTLDAVRVPAEKMRCFEAGPEGLELLAFGAPHVESAAADVEMAPNWWAD
jgi:mannose-6-phosphate isomerase-like protein (cupin superfamily)